jgi:hypothetical protein
MQLMNIYSPLRILIGVCGISLSLSAVDLPRLDSHLEPLRPWLDKTWKSQPKNPKGGKATTDVTRWERALNGNAIRILHSINDGAYGGEAIVRWDEKKQAVVYDYFTTASFTTAGTMTFKDGKILTHEVVTGDADGVSEVRGIFEINPDGTFQKRTESLKNGAWQPATETTYREDPSAVVVFK